jgi:hypothetical protein
MRRRRRSAGIESDKSIGIMSSGRLSSSVSRASDQQASQFDLDAQRSELPMK